MKRTVLKILLIIFAVLISLYAGVMIYFRYFFDVNRYAEELKSAIETQTGGVLTYNEVLCNVRIPFLKISVRDAELKNNSFDIKLENPEVKLGVFDIFTPGKFKKIKIDGIVADFSGSENKIAVSGAKDLKKIISSEFFKQLKKTPEIYVSKYRVKIVKAGKPFILEGVRASSVKKSSVYDNKLKGTLLSDNKIKVNYDLEILSDRKIPSNLRSDALFKEFYKLEPEADLFARLAVSDTDNKEKIYGTTILNKMSFKLNSERLSDNFVYFSFDDNNVSVNADLKTSSIGGIKIKGDYVNDKEPLLKLDVKSKNVDIAGIKELTELFGLNSDKIQNLKDYKLSGKCDTDFYIVTNFKNITSSGSALIKNGAITDNADNISLTNINSEILFDNNVITLKPTEFTINDTNIGVEGITGIDTDLKIYGNNIDISKVQPFINTFFKFKDLNISGEGNLALNLTGKTDDISLQGNINLKNPEIYTRTGKTVRAENAKIKISGKRGTCTGNLSFTDASISVGKEIFKTPHLKAEVLKDRIVIPSTEFKSGNKTLTANADIENIGNNPEINGKFSLITPARDAAKYTEFSKNTFPAKGTLNISGSFSDRNNETKADISWNTNSDNFIEIFPVPELRKTPCTYSAKLTILPKLVKVNDFTVTKSGGRVLAGNYTFENGKMKKYSLKINSPLTFNIREFNNAEATLKGDFAGSNGNIPEFANAQISVLKIPSNDIVVYNGYMTTDSKGVKINFPDVKAGNTKFGISGFLISQNGSRPKFVKGKIEGSELDFETFEKFAASNLKGFDISDTLFVLQNLNFSDFKIKNLSGKMKIKNNTVNFSELKGETCKGKISGALDYNIVNGEKHLNITGKNSDFNEFFSAVTGREENVKGSADYVLNIKTSGQSAYAHRKNATGTFDVSVKNGNIGALTDYSNYVKAQNFISQNSFKAALPAVKQQLNALSVNTFQIMKIKGKVQSTSLAIDNCTATGTDVSLYINGRLNELTGSANVNVYGKISDRVKTASGKFANPVDKSIMTSSDNTSVNNLFYDSFFTKISPDNSGKIPYLKNCAEIFTARIEGLPDKIRSVKYLKWHDKD